MMRDLCGYFTSSCFLFPVGGESKHFNDILGLGVGYQFGGIILLGGSVSHYMLWLYGTQNVVQDNLSSNFYSEQIEFINKIYAC